MPRVPVNSREKYADTLSELFAGLVTPARVHILLLLADTPAGLSPSDMQEILKQPQPTVSSHLRMLRNMGLVERESNPEDCRFAVYTLKAGPLISTLKTLCDRLDSGG